MKAYPPYRDNKVKRAKVQYVNTTPKKCQILLILYLFNIYLLVYSPMP